MNKKMRNAKIVLWCSIIMVICAVFSIISFFINGMEHTMFDYVCSLITKLFLSVGYLIITIPIYKLMIQDTKENSEETDSE